MNTVYFAKKGEQGLSSTHANHLANLAKEMQEQMSDMKKIINDILK